MSLKCVREPVIIAGMHRSGTTMVAGVLKELGFFIGNDLEANNESLYFIFTNAEILRRINASWDNPGPVKYFLENKDALDMTVKCLEYDVLSPGIRDYLGWKNYLKYRSVTEFDMPWGWKDPRNTFTLPLWLRLFPRSKIIHMVRNGVDVAYSLMVREKEELKRREEIFQRRFNKRSRRSKLEQTGFKGSARCLTLSGGFSLWEDYMEQGYEALKKIGNERYEIKYEQFLADPGKHLKELAGFCGLEGVSGLLEKAGKNLNRSRANAFRNDPSLLEFYHRVKDTRWMKHYGYSFITG